MQRIHANKSGGPWYPRNHYPNPYTGRSFSKEAGLQYTKIFPNNQPFYDLNPQWKFCSQSASTPDPAAGVLYFPQNDGHPLQREITNLAPPQIQNFVKLIKTTLENMTNNR